MSKPAWPNASGRSTTPAFFMRLGRRTAGAAARASCPLLRRCGVFAFRRFRMVQKVDPTLGKIPVVLLSADGRMEEKARVLETDGAIRKAPVQRRIGARHKAKRDEDEQSRC